MGKRGKNRKRGRWGDVADTPLKILRAGALESGMDEPVCANCDSYAGDSCLRTRQPQIPFGICLGWQRYGAQPDPLD